MPAASPVKERDHTVVQESRQGTGLRAEPARAIEDYSSKWQAVDEELYELCRRRASQQNFADVYAKVVMVGRVYAAGISRSSRAPGDREAEVARGLVDAAGLIEHAQGKLAGREFDRATAIEIVELHHSLTRSLLQRTGKCLAHILCLEVSPLSLRQRPHLRQPCTQSDQPVRRPASGLGGPVLSRRTRRTRPRL